MEHWNDYRGKSEERIARSNYSEMSTINQIEEHLASERRNNHYLTIKNESLRSANQQFVKSYESLKMQMKDLLQERTVLFQKNVSLVYEQSRLKKELLTYKDLLCKSSSKNKALLLNLKTAYDELVKSTSLLDEFIATFPRDKDHIVTETEYLSDIGEGAEESSPTWRRICPLEPILTPVQEEQTQMTILNVEINNDCQSQSCLRRNIFKISETTGCIIRAQPNETGEMSSEDQGNEYFGKKHHDISSHDELIEDVNKKSELENNPVTTDYIQETSNKINDKSADIKVQEMTFIIHVNGEEDRKDDVQIIGNNHSERFEILEKENNVPILQTKEVERENRGRRNFFPPLQDIMISTSKTAPSLNKNNESYQVVNEKISKTEHFNQNKIKISSELELQPYVSSLQNIESTTNKEGLHNDASKHEFIKDEEEKQSKTQKVGKNKKAKCKKSSKVNAHKKHSYGIKVKRQKTSYNNSNCIDKEHIINNNEIDKDDQEDNGNPVNEKINDVTTEVKPKSSSKEKIVIENPTPPLTRSKKKIVIENPIPRLTRSKKKIVIENQTAFLTNCKQTKENTEPGREEKGKYNEFNRIIRKKGLKQNKEGSSSSPFTRSKRKLKPLNNKETSKIVNKNKKTGIESKTNDDKENVPIEYLPISTPKSTNCDLSDALNFNELSISPISKLICRSELDNLGHISAQTKELLIGNNEINTHFVMNPIKRNEIDPSNLNDEDQIDGKKKYTILSDILKKSNKGQYSDEDVVKINKILTCLTHKINEIKSDEKKDIPENSIESLRDDSGISNRDNISSILSTISPSFVSVLRSLDIEDELMDTRV